MKKNIMIAATKKTQQVNKYPLFTKKLSCILKVVFLLTIGLCNADKLAAQQYPVQGTLIVTSPYPSYLSDYASSTMEKLILNLICTDINLVNQRVRLKVSIYQGASLLAKSTDAIINEPMISLNGGIPLRLTSAELANYFKLDNLQGIAPNAYAQTLPEGVYSITFQVYDYFTGNKLSGDISQQFWLMLNDPPLLASPLDKENIQQGTGLNPQIAFQWTPRTTQVSNSEYEFTLVELWDEYGDPYQQFLASAPKYKTTTNNTTIMYGITEPPLLPGHRYAWRVQAKAKQGLEDIGLYRNDGYSNIYTFKYAGQCDAIQTIDGQVKGSDRIYLEWQQPPQTMSLNGSGQSGMYKVAYRKYTTSNQWEWVELPTTNGYINLTNLDGNTEYEIKVGNICDNNLIGYSQPLRLRTQQTGTDLNVNCGQAPTIDLSNKTLLQKLSVYDVVTATDFPITITRAEGNANGWNGEGWVKVPYLADTKIHVIFNGIKVNTDYKLIDGYFETVYDASGKNIGDIDQTISDVKGLVMPGTNVGKMKTGADSAKYTVDFDLPEDCGSCKFTPYEGGAMNETDGDKKNNGAGTIDFGNGNTLKVDTLPTTIKDKSGDIYKVEQTADGKGVATARISSTGGAALIAKANKQKIDTDKGIVIFSAHPKQQYAFDSYIDAYRNNSNWDKSFEKIGDYRVPAKAIAPGVSDVVTATITLSGDLQADKVQFVNTTSTVYVSKALDKDKGVYEVTVVGGPAADAQEVYALYPQNDKPLNLGKLLIASYAQKQLTVKLVPVNGATAFDSKRISDSLNAIYNPVNVKVNVSTAANFNTDVFDKSQGLIVGGKNFFNAYSDDMKALNSAYTSSTGIDKNTTYLFVLNKAADGTVLGDMPRSKQFGYIFLQGNNDVEHTTAHEIGHGAFDLQHVFDYKGITQGALPNNLMDYPAGSNLTKYQWDCLHDPALLAGLLDGKEDVMLQKGASLYKCLNNELQNLLAKKQLLYAPNGEVVELPIGATPNSVFYKDISTANKAKKGSLASFILNGKEYSTIYNISSQAFVAYSYTTEDKTTYINSRPKKEGEKVTEIEISSDDNNCEIKVNGVSYSNENCKCQNSVYQKNYDKLIKEVIDSDKPEVKAEIESLCRTLDDLPKDVLQTNNQLFKYTYNNFDLYWYDWNTPNPITTLEALKKIHQQFKDLNDNIEKLKKCEFKTADEIVDFINDHFVVSGTKMSYLTDAQFRNLSPKTRVCLIEKMLDGNFGQRYSVASNNFGGQNITISILQNCGSEKEFYQVIEQIKADGKLFTLLSKMYDYLYVTEGNFTQLCLTITNAYVGEIKPASNNALVKELIQAGKWLIYDNGYLTARNKEDFNEKTNKIDFTISDGGGKYLVDALGFVTPGAQWLFKDFGRAQSFDKGFDPLEMLIVIPKRDVAAFGTTLEKGRMYVLPAVSVYLLFKLDTKSAIGTSGALVLNTALCAVGVGALSGASTVAIALETTDIALSTFVTYANSSTEMYQDHPEFTKYTNYLAIAYTVGRLGYAGYCKLPLFSDHL